MKSRRVLLVGAGVLLVLLVLVALAFSSGVQTWAARRALAARSDLSGQIGRVDVGLSHVSGQDVLLLGDGFRLTLPRFDADLSVLGAARERLEVRRLVAKGWTLEITGSTPGPVAAAPPRSHAGLVPGFLAQVAPGTDPAAPAGVSPVDVLAALELPVDIVALDQVELEGKVIVPDSAGGAPRVVPVRLTGGGLSPSSSGSFAVSASASEGATDAPVSALQLDARLQVSLSSPRTLRHVVIESVVHAQGARVPDGAELRWNLTAGTTGTGPSHYAFNLRNEARPLLQVEAQPAPDGAARLAGTWKLDLTDADLSPFALGTALPSFTAVGEGLVDFAPEGASVGASGTVRARVDGLSTVRSELAVVGPVSTALEFAARRVGEDVRVTRLRLLVENERPVLELAARQGLEYNLETGELRVADPEGDLFDLNLHGLPSAWLQPFLPGYELVGGNWQGAWAATARDGGFSFRSSAPLRAGGISIREEGRELLTGLDVAFSVSGEYLPTGWQGRVERGHVQAGSRRLVNFDARAGKAAVAGAALVATSRFNLDAGAWLTQPVAASLGFIAAGGVSGEFIVALSEKIELAAEVDVADLRTADDQPLPRLTLEVRADVAEDGRIEAHVPLQIRQAGRASDVTLDAQVVPGAEKVTINGVASGQHVFLQDLQLLLAPLAARDAPPEQPGETVPGPVWQGLEGRLAVNFGTLVYSDALTVTNVAGELILGPDALRVPRLEATLATGGKVEMEGALRHDADATEAYALEGNVAAANIEVGQLMSALAPGSRPPVEGQFDFSGSLHGRASDLAALADHTAAEAQLSSRGGTLRALSVTVAEYTRSASAVAGLIGSLTGDSRAKRVKAAIDLADQLANLNFDQLNIDVVRHPGEEIAIRDFSLISPAIRLLGAGTIGDTPGQSLWREPLQMRFQLSAREAVAENLKTLRLLKETADTLGYLPMTEELTLEGSLGDISRTQLQNLISRALAL